MNIIILCWFLSTTSPSLIKTVGHSGVKSIRKNKRNLKNITKHSPPVGLHHG